MGWGTSNGDLLGDFMAFHHGFNLGFHSLNSTLYLWIHGAFMVILAEENGAGLKLLAAIKFTMAFITRFLYAASMVIPI